MNEEIYTVQVKIEMVIWARVSAFSKADASKRALEDARLKFPTADMYVLQTNLGAAR
jgi:hypothetical protein